jgi:RNA polymerase sigma-70 factor (ECF subfamily)
MSDGEIHTAVEFIHGLVVDPKLASQTDNELLKRFLANRHENAFEALVRRHGPMVLGLCRRILHDPLDAEDAFQAVFLVFVSKAASIAKPELLGNWLYGVACRTALAARAAAENRRMKEAEAASREQPNQDSPWQELQLVLDRELSRLPAKYRIPIVLCHLEEKSRRQAARTLGLPEGTLSSRLARGRALLAQRLTRWCPSVAGAVFLAGFGKQAMAAPLPTALVRATTKAGISQLAGQPTSTALVSSRAVLLSQGVLRAMFLTKLRIAATMLCAGSLLACVVGTAASRGLGTEDGSPAAVAAANSADGSLMKQVVETTKDISDARSKLRVLMRIAAVQDSMGDPAGARRTRQEASELAKSFAAGIPRADALLQVAWSQIEAKDRSAIFETLRQAEQAGAVIEGESEKPSWLSRFIFARATAGDYEGALRTLAQGGNYQGHLLSTFGYRLNTENKIAARKAIMNALAMAKFEENRAIGEGIDGLSGAAFALVKAGDLDQALATAAKLGEWKDYCLKAIVAAQAAEGDIAGAVRTAKSIQQANVKADALNATIRARVKAGDLAAARSTLSEVRELVENLPNRKIGDLRGRIALSQLLLGDKSAALVTAGAIESDMQKADALREMGITLIKAGKLIEAREMLLGASQAAQRVVPGVDGAGWPSQFAKATNLSVIARDQANAGDIKEALRTADIIPTAREMDDALAKIAPAQAEAGDRSGALKTIARIREEAAKAETLEDLTQTLVRAGYENDALGLVAQQTAPAFKARALLGVISGRTKPRLPKP